jgi:adenine-specific DNA-methyltransferase
LIDTQRHRKDRGAFFTPPQMSRFLVDWAVRDPTETVLEPSCGEASFLIPAGARLRELSSGPAIAERQLRGIEMHGPSAARARELLSAAGLVGSVETGDFFESDDPGSCDAVIGNPPYVRYQTFRGTTRARAIERALAQGVRLTGLASSWAPFVIHAADFLKPGGRLGLVLPAELLTVNYAAAVRRFLLNRFARVRLILFEELVFPGVLEEVVLLLAEGAGPSASFELIQIRDVEALQSIDLADWTSFTPDTTGKWTPALLTGGAVQLYRRLTDEGAFSTLLDWGETYLGAVTGNNRYFSRTIAQVEEDGLADRDLIKISPPGSRHLRGLTFTEQMWGELIQNGAACYLFYPEQDLSLSAKKHIQNGEAAGIHNAYKCRKRSPWYRVPLVRVPDLLLTYMDYERPRILTNAAHVHHLNSVYGVSLRPDLRALGTELLPIASINTLSVLGAEMVGRAYGGGLLKLEPKEADKLPVPSPALIDLCAVELRELRPRVEEALRRTDVGAAIEMVDSVILKSGVGVHDSELDLLRAAREFLFARRVTRGGGTGGATEAR